MDSSTGAPSMIEKPGRLFGAAFIVAVTTFLFYGCALIFTGPALRSATTVCKREGFRELQERFLPLSDKCLYRDGSSEQLVPFLVNAVIFLGLTVVGCFFLLGWRAAFKKYCRPIISKLRNLARAA
jgi:hypothetical protein